MLSFSVVTPGPEEFRTGEFDSWGSATYWKAIDLLAPLALVLAHYRYNFCMSQKLNCLLTAIVRAFL